MRSTSFMTPSSQSALAPPGSFPRLPERSASQFRGQALDGLWRTFAKVKKDCGMDIVSTGMHNAGNLGLKREIIFLPPPERVDVRAERDAWTGFSPFMTATVLVPEIPSISRTPRAFRGAADVSGSVCLPERRAPVSVQVTACFDQFFS